MRKHVEHESFHHDKLQCKKSVTTVNIKITFTTHFTTIMRKTELSRELILTNGKCLSMTWEEWGCIVICRRGGIEK